MHQPPLTHQSHNTRQSSVDGSRQRPFMPNGADVGLLLLALSVVLWSWLPLGSNIADTVEIQQANQERQHFPLSSEKAIVVEGPLGETVIEIIDNRVRVKSSPGVRQLCVKQGWLTDAGDTAVCLPNQIIVTLTGNSPLRQGYDAINF